MTDVIFTQERHVGMITLNRPQALNALTLPMIRAMQQQLTQWLSDSTVHAVVIRSNQTKAFCAGGDIRWLYEMGTRDQLAQMQFFEEEYQLNQLIHDYSKPYIALMDGITMGGGVGISLHGSHPVASHTFVFAMPETSIGFFPDIGASYLLSRCPGAMGIYLGLSGNRLNADESRASGLVKYVIASSAFEEVIHALINTDLSSEAKDKVEACLASFSEEINTDSFTRLQTNVNECFNHQEVKSIFDALACHEDEWHLKLLEQLQQKSPLSLCVTLKQLLEARSLTVGQCLQQDFHLAKHFMTGHDFYEGVRAFIIDKDKSPQWSPSSLSEVSNQLINDYFD